MPNTQDKKRILITPLDWGLGHATRSIPIINEFLNRDCEVQIASSGNALILLKKEFPELKFHELVSYEAKYSSSLPFMLKILFQLPKFLFAIKKEHQHHYWQMLKTAFRFRSPNPGEQCAKACRHCFYCEQKLNQLRND